MHFNIGYTVLQKRQNGLVNFYENWFNYKNGFGNLKLTQKYSKSQFLKILFIVGNMKNGEFWLGLEKMSALTLQNNYS